MIMARASNKTTRARRIAAVADHEGSTPVRRDDATRPWGELLDALALHDAAHA